MAKTVKKKTLPPVKAAKAAAQAKTKSAPKSAATPARKSGPEKGISRSPYAVYERGLRDLAAQAQKLQRQGERLMKDDKATARKIFATAKGVSKLVEKGAILSKKAA